MDARGNFVAVWQSYGQNGSMYGIYARRFNAAGKALGGEFRVNTITMYDQQYPAIAVDRSGNFLIVWESYGQDGSSTGIYTRRYNTQGQPFTSEVQVNKYTKSYQARPRVAVDPNGNFIVAWESDGQDGNSYGVYTCKLNNKGQISGSEFRVNKYTKSVQDFPALVSDPAGNILISWTSYGQDSDNDGVFFRAFKTSDQPISSDVQVNIYTRYTQMLPKIAADGLGNFVVVWQDGGQGGSGDGIYARVFTKYYTPGWKFSPVES